MWTSHRLFFLLMALVLLSSTVDCRGPSSHLPRRRAHSGSSCSAGGSHSSHSHSSHSHSTTSRARPVPPRTTHVDQKKEDREASPSVKTKTASFTKPRIDENIAPGSGLWGPKISTPSKDSSRWETARKGALESAVSFFKEVCKHELVLWAVEERFEKPYTGSMGYMTQH